MKKTTYWKDVWRTFVASKGRMLSIALLMALGSFALIGLKVTSPNMKKTGEHFFKTHQTADLTLILASCIRMTRSAIGARDALWVTIITVVSCLRAIS